MSNITNVLADGFGIEGSEGVWGVTAVEDLFDRRCDGGQGLAGDRRPDDEVAPVGVVAEFQVQGVVEPPERGLWELVELSRCMR
jgi:hypothetical protein